MLQTILVLNVLAYGPPGGSIQGGVWLEVATSPNSLVGLGEVEVQLLLAGKTISSIRTAKTGTFRFIALAPGKYSVRAVPPHDKYFTNTDDGTWLGATQIGSTSDRIRGIDFKMKAAVVSEDPEWPPLKYSSRAIAGGPNSLQFAIRRQPTGRVANFSTPDQDGMLQASPLHLASGPSGGSIQGGVWLEDGKIPTSAVGLGGVEVQLLSAGKCSCAVLHSTYECILPVVFSGQDVKGAPMEVAPPPRDLSYSNLAGGTVTSIDRTSITVQGLDVRVKDRRINNCRIMSDSRLNCATS